MSNSAINGQMYPKRWLYCTVNETWPCFSLSLVFAYHASLEIITFFREGFSAPMQALPLPLIPGSPKSILGQNESVIAIACGQTDIA